MTYIYSKKYKNKQSRGIAISSILIIISIICLGLLYLYQTNALVGDTYQIRDYKKQIQELKKEHQQLEEKVFELSSLDKLQEMIEPLNMVDVGEVIYLQEETVVKK